jgi:hypothetical protein
VLGERHVQEARDLREQVDSPWYSVFDLLGLVRPEDKITDPGTIQRLTVAVDHVAESELVVGRPPAAFRPLGLLSVHESLLTRTDPRTSVSSRVASMITIGSTELAPENDGGIISSPAGDRVMVAPRIDVPLYSYLSRLDPARFLPGVAAIPENSLTVLKTNPRFVEALLVGVNHELSRELLWRGFPTDQRGTSFRRFWDRTDGTDIEAIDRWPDDNGLGANGPGDPDGQVALLVRGELLRRYPNAAVYAWRADGDVLRKEPRVPEDLRNPVFAGVLAQDTAFVGFDLGAAELASGDGWFFVISEQPTEPRFGFDELDGTGPPPTLTAWSAATWEHTGTAPGGYLRLAGNPLTGIRLDGARFADHAGHVAAITRQKPMRIALQAGGLPELVAP